MRASSAPIWPTSPRRGLERTPRALRDVDDDGLRVRVRLGRDERRVEFAKQGAAETGSAGDRHVGHRVALVAPHARKIMVGHGLRVFAQPAKVLPAAIGTRPGWARRQPTSAPCAADERGPTSQKRRQGSGSIRTVRARRRRRRTYETANIVTITTIATVKSEPTLVIALPT